MTKKGIHFSIGELKKHKLLETVSTYIEQRENELFMTKMKMAVLQASKEKIKMSD